MYVPTGFDTVLLFLFSSYSGGNRPAINLLTYHHVKFFMPFYRYI